MGFVATCWSPAAAGLLEAVRRAATQLAAAGLAPGLGPREALIEARLDLLATPPASADLALLAGAAEGRLLATCRAGGAGAPEGRADRLALLARAGSEGAAAVDVEEEALAPGPARGALAGLPGRVGLVLSSHAEGLLSTAEAARRAASMAGRSPEVVKLAAPVGCAGEALDLAMAGAGLGAEVAWAPVPLGPAGAWLRLLACCPSGLPGRPWSALSYVAAGAPLPGPEGPWQPALADVLAVHRAHAVGARTAVFGIFGWPLGATWSPLLHGTLFRERRADALLVPLPVRDVAEGERLAAALGLAGAAVTAPHKTAALALAATVSRSAREARALNTLRREAGGGLGAASFDGAAAAEALAAVAPPLDGAHVLVLGGGGTARCVMTALLARRARVTLAVRRPEALQAEAARLGGTVVAWTRQAEVAADLLVNATPLGSAGAPPLDIEQIPWGCLRGVLDCTTFPVTTALVLESRRRGVPAADGLAMLARQAAAQQAFWGALPAEGGEGESLAPLPVARTESLLRQLASERPRP